MEYSPDQIIAYTEIYFPFLEDKRTESVMSQINQKRLKTALCMGLICFIEGNNIENLTNLPQGGWVFNADFPIDEVQLADIQNDQKHFSRRATLKINENSQGETEVTIGQTPHHVDTEAGKNKSSFIQRKYVFTYKKHGDIEVALQNGNEIETEVIGFMDEDRSRNEFLDETLGILTYYPINSISK